MAGTNFIKRDLHITVKDNISTLDEKLYLFQNDKNIDLYFTIENFKFNFLMASQSTENMVVETNAKYSTIKVLKPNGAKIVSDSKLPIEDNRVLFTITEDFIDALDEIGKYKLQISLYDDQDGKITIPHVEFDVLQPIFPEDFVEEYLMGQIDITKIGMSRIAPEIAQASIQELKNRLADSKAEIQDTSNIGEIQAIGDTLFRWQYADIISAERMNLINQNIDDLWVALDDLENSLNLDASNVTYSSYGYTSVQEALDYLLYTPLAINSLSLSVGNTIELGRILNGCAVTWSYNKSTVTEQTLTIGGQAISGLSLSSRSYSYTNQISSNTSFVLTGKDEKNSTATRTINITYCNRIYWGVSSSTTYNNSFFINELTNSILSDNKNRRITVNAGTGQYIYYAIPSRLGTCTFKVGGFEGGFSNVATFSLRNTYGFTEDYAIYRSDNTSLGNTTVEIS